MSQGIWILEEHDSRGTRNISLELLSEGQKLARKLKEELCVCLLGYQVEDIIPKLGEFGAQKVYLAGNKELSEYNLDAFVAILGCLIERYQPSILMIGATPTGSELAPRIAARYGLSCITEVKKLGGNSEKIQVTKSVYNDRLYADVKPASARPLIITLPPGETDIVKPKDSVNPELIKIDFEFTEKLKRIRYKQFIKGDPRTIRVDEADLILALGNGVDSESLPVAEELADLLGATLGGTRVAVDNGIIPFERQIGLTGKTVLPNMLIACGISGAYEFTDGMKDSKMIIAINNDGKARIFEVANLGVNGDLKEIIPAVIEKIKNHKQTLN